MLRKSGFTLAEVLITLGIIGVVAAMTIPTLISSTNSTEYKSAFKKAISSLNQAITMNVAMDGLDFGDLDATGTGASSVYNMFNARMNVVSTSTADAGNYTLFFSDGMSVSFPTGIVSCTAVTTANCAVRVDVNGQKGPNVLTTATDKIKDQFGVRVFKQQVQPNGAASRYVLFN